MRAHACSCVLSSIFATGRCVRVAGNSRRLFLRVSDLESITRSVRKGRHHIDQPIGPKRDERWPLLLKAILTTIPSVAHWHGSVGGGATARWQESYAVDLEEKGNVRKEGSKE